MDTPINSQSHPIVPFPCILCWPPTVSTCPLPREWHVWRKRGVVPLYADIHVKLGRDKIQSSSKYVSVRVGSQPPNMYILTLELSGAASTQVQKSTRGDGVKGPEVPCMNQLSEGCLASLEFMMEPTSKTDIVFMLLRDVTS